MVKEKKEVITKKDGSELSLYTIQWPAEKVIKTKLKLIKVFGGLFFVLGGMDSNSDAIPAIEKVISGIDDSAAYDIMRDIVGYATVNGQKITVANFNEIFEDVTDFYRTFFFVLKANYSDFLPERLGQVFQQKMRETGLTE